MIRFHGVRCGFYSLCDVLRYSQPKLHSVHGLFFFFLSGFIHGIFQLPALSRNPNVLSFPSDNRFLVCDFFLYGMSCLIIKINVRNHIHLQYIYVEYNIMRPKESCLEISPRSDFWLSDC